MRVSAFFRNLFRRGRVERELDQEVQAYAAMLADEHTARGMDADRARRAALAQMRGVDIVKGQVREDRAGAGVDRFAQDVRFTFRTLRKSPGFTAIAVTTLALGIGATTAIFSVVDGVLLQPLPYPDAGRVAIIWNHFSPQNMERGPLSMADYLDLRAQTRAVEAPAAVRSTQFDLTDVASPEQIQGAQVSAGFFSILRVAPMLGRTFVNGEDSPSSPNLAVISEFLWQRRFGGNPSVVGQPITLSGQRAVIVGVMPQSFQFPRRGIDVWMNLKLQAPTRRGPFFLMGVARLKDGVTWAQAQADTNRVAHNIEIATHGGYKNATMPILPIREALIGNARLPLFVMFGAVLAVLLIASANTANLLLARGTTRQREIAVRLSLGARRGRIVRQLLTESLVLAGAGCAGGTAIAWLGVAFLRQWSAGSIPRMASVRMNLDVFAFTVAVGLGAALLFGILPALYAARADLTAPLKDGGRGTVSGGPSGRRIRSSLVVIELALAVVLLVCGGLFLRSFERLQRTETGIHAPGDQVLTMLVSLPRNRYSDAKSQTAFYDRALEHVSGLPDVESAAWSDSLAPVFWNNNDTFHLIGRPWSQEAFPSSPLPTVSENYFRVLDVPILRGRTFDAHDVATSSLVAVVSDTFVRRYFPNDDPIGQQVAPSAPGLKNPPYRIIGVVGDVKFGGLQSAPESVWYSALAQGPDVQMFLLVRTSRPVAGLASSIEGSIRSIDKDVIFSKEGTLASVIGDAVAQPRFRTALLVLFGSIALLLAAVGTYGVMAYLVSQRTHEIGVRMALGARPNEVVRLVVDESARLAGIGIALGIVAAVAASRTLTSLLFSTPATDPATYAAVILILLSAVGWATVSPARRAAHVDPLVALRND